MKESTATERVGRYQLLEPIGGGPNGMVSRAKVFGVAGFERQFAVKRFLAELTVGASAQALSQAARSYGSLEHPRIARMSEFGVAQGQTFTAVELVPGLDVFRLMQESKLAAVAIPPGGALALVSQAARAVGYAHGRGLSHLGLSPTNVIVTADGDVKVTDFGILAATMPSKPVELPRLSQRIPYLAPEQLANEATSAATDVFVLGVLAYELVTNQRAYRGDYPAAVAQAILAGPPAEPPLPRPIVRVLQRCLARSPFERFPDARALADALDAALRVAPVPGTRKDIGAMIKATLDRYATLNEGNLSGMVALNLGTQQQADPQHSSRPEARTEPSAMPVVPSGPASTMRDMPKPFTTVPGLAPPPIPVPPGVTPPPGAPASPPGTSPTILGMTAVKKPFVPSTIPTIKKPNGPPPSIPSITKPAAPPAPPAPPVPGKLTMGWDAVPEPPTPPPPPPPTPGKLTMGWDAMPEPALAADAPIEEPSGLIEVDDSGPVKVPTRPMTDDDDIRTVPFRDPTPPGPHSVETSPGLPFRMPRPTPGQSFESTTGEMSQTMLESLNRKAQLSTSEMVPVAQQRNPTAPEISIEPGTSPALPAAPPGPFDHYVEEPGGDFVNEASAGAHELAEPSPSSTMPGHTPAQPRRDSQPGSSQPGTSQLGIQPPSVSAPSMNAPVAASAPPRTSQPSAPKTKSKLPAVLLAVVLVGGLGAGGYYVYTTQFANKETEVAVGPGSAKTGSAAVKTGSATTGSAEVKTGSATETGSAEVKTGSATETGSAEVKTGSATETGSAEVKTGSATETGSAGSAAVAKPPDAGAEKPGPDTPNVATPSGASDQLQITSNPKGAHVFLDGADQGETPVKLPGSTDRHSLAVMLPGHDLYLAEVDGHGVFDVELKAIEKGPKAFGGIKVLKCKPNRYYVYVDGKPTGQTCPTERLNVVVGPHAVEIYDLVTESRRKFNITVKDEGASERIRLE